jgi:hypothetical protein
MTLYGDYLAADHRPMHKWYQYFAAYEQHFERFRNQHITVFEIGIGQGGSLQQWRRYFGPFAVIVGLDINPQCKQVEEDQVYVRIGSQNDTAFLASVVAEFGNPDIVIDDGSHIQSDITTTFDFLFPYVAKNGVYLVEDLHAAYWPKEGGGLRHPESFIERAKGFVDQMHAEYTWAHYLGDGLPRSTLGDRARSIHFHDSVIVVEVGEYRPKRHQTTGTPGLFRQDWQPSDQATNAPLPPPPLAVASQSAPQAVLDQIVNLHARVRQLEQAAAPLAPPPVDTAMRQRIGALEAELAALRNSTSWRIMAPLRALVRLTRR